MIKVFSILTYSLYVLLLFLFVFDYENYNQDFWETVTNYWCFAYCGAFLGTLLVDTKFIDGFSAAVFITILCFAGLDLLWYNTPMSEKYNLPIYTACYFTILLCTFVFNEIFRRR